MKRFFSIIMVLTITISAMAYKPKDFDKYIDKLDVWEYVKDTPREHPAYFWAAIVKNDPKGQQFAKDREKGKEAALNALRAIADGQLASAEYIMSLESIYEAKAYCDSLTSWIGLEDLKDYKISVYYDNDPNAFCTPQGKIFIADTLVYLQNFNSNRMLGITAHETAHYMLAHSLIGAYETEKRLKKNKIAGAIIAGVNAAATGYAQAQGAYTEKTAAKAWEQVNETTLGLFNAAYKDAYGKFRYKYSREQEIQSDLVAIRFLQWNGLSGQEYIAALRELGTEADKYYDSKSEHPKMEFRIALLEYLLSDYVPKSQRGYKGNKGCDTIYE